MKRIFTMPLIALFAASCLSSAHASPLSAAGAAAMIKNTLGTFTCTVGSKQHKATFTSMFGGHQMAITESDNSSLVTFDVKRQKWIDEYIGSDGSYSVMEGTPVKDGIDFTGVYPAGFNANLHVRYIGKDKMTTSFSMMMNGKMATSNETCVR